MTRNATHYWNGVFLCVCSRVNVFVYIDVLHRLEGHLGFAGTLLASCTFTHVSNNLFVVFVKYETLYGKEAAAERENRRYMEWQNADQWKWREILKSVSMNMSYILIRVLWN